MLKKHGLEMIMEICVIFPQPIIHELFIDFTKHVILQPTINAVNVKMKEMYIQTILISIVVVEYRGLLLDPESAWTSRDGTEHQPAVLPEQADR